MNKSVFRIYFLIAGKKKNHNQDQSSPTTSPFLYMKYNNVLSCSQHKNKNEIKYKSKMKNKVADEETNDIHCVDFMTFSVYFPGGR